MQSPPSKATCCAYAQRPIHKLVTYASLPSQPLQTPRSLEQQEDEENGGHVLVHVAG